MQFMSDEIEKNDRGDLFSKAVKAGKRTYFFDVKSTRGNDYYLTITESKKRFGTDGKFFYEKHKVFLYKEDFEKFTEALNESIDIIKANAPAIVPVAEGEMGSSDASADIDFDDLGK